MGAIEDDFMPAFEVTPTAPQQQLSPRKASVATSATNSVAASNALKPVVVSLPASDSNKLAAAARGGGGGCKGQGSGLKRNRQLHLFLCNLLLPV